MVTKQHFKNNIFVVLFEHSYSLLIVLKEKKPVVLLWRQRLFNWKLKTKNHKNLHILRVFWRHFTHTWIMIFFLDKFIEKAAYVLNFNAISVEGMAVAMTFCTTRNFYRFSLVQPAVLICWKMLQYIWYKYLAYACFLE